MYKTRFLYRFLNGNYRVVLKRHKHLITTFDDLTKSKRISRRFPQFSSDLFDLRSEIQFKNLSGHQTDGLLQQAMDESDSKMVMEILLRGKPTRYSLEKLLHQSVKIPKTIDAIKRLQGEPAWMQPYFAASLWYRGNLTDASNQFKTLFFQNDKNTVLLVLREITIDTVGKKSEATLIILTQLAEYFACLFDDFRLLYAIWRAAFTSEWYSDHQHAAQLFAKHSHLQNMIRIQSAKLSQMFLIADRVDMCQRFLELYLKLNDRDAVQSILTVMFDHSYLRRDMRRCSAILQFSQKVEIPIGKSLGFRIANLLMDREVKPKILPPKFKFKF